MQMLTVIKSVSVTLKWDFIPGLWALNCIIHLPVLHWPTSYPVWNRLPLSTIINWKLEINGSELSTSLPVCIWVTCLLTQLCLTYTVFQSMTERRIHTVSSTLLPPKRCYWWLCWVSFGSRCGSQKNTHSPRCCFFFSYLSDSVLMKIVFYMQAAWPQIKRWIGGQ